MGEMNDNGERFADLCAIKNLAIGGSFSPTQEYIQGYTGLPGPQNSKPNRPRVYREEIQTFSPRCPCKKRS